MKITIWSFALGLLVLMSCNDEKVVKDTELPGQAKEFIEAHFASAKVKHVVKDRDDLEVTYEVTLDNQVKLSFKKDGECYDAESPRALKLPDSILPLKVLDYVKANYGNDYIVEWEKDKTDQEVKLSNGTELIFNLSGTFLRVDN